MSLITADFIFDGYGFLPSNTVLNISDDGVILEIFQHNGSRDVKRYRGLLMPGMVNAHCHLELSHLKGKVPRGSGLVSFLLSILSLRAQTTSAEKQLAIELAEKEMKESGIVAVGDISNTLDTLQQKARGNLLYHTFVECFGLREERAVEILNQALNIQSEFSKYHRSSVVLHAPYSISNKLIQVVDEVNAGKITSIHNQECEAENELFLRKSGDFLRLYERMGFDVKDFVSEGKNSIQTLLPKCLQQKQMILVHNTCSSEADILWANDLKKDLYWCLCPKANLYIEGILPDIEMMIENDCTLVIGTDSLASNDSLSILDEIKTIQLHKPNIPIEHMLKWATSNGAKALGMQDLIGSFEAGKKPGVMHIKNFSHNKITPQNGRFAERIF